MSSLPLHIVLLIAVAYSQIFGGVSCCCLSRLIIASLASAHDVATVDQHGQVTQNMPSVPKCPGCAASQTSAKRSVNACRSQDESVAASSDCQCTKASSSAIVQLEPRSQSSSTQSVATPTATWDLVPLAAQGVLRGHEVPIRFGGHSWQSMACVWKK